MSYYVYAFVSESNSNILLSEDDIIRDEDGDFINYKKVADTGYRLYYPDRFDDKDYEFIKQLWAKHVPNEPYDFEVPFRITKETIEEWELFKQDTWYEDYDTEEHEFNCNLLKEAEESGTSIYLYVA